MYKKKTLIVLKSVFVFFYMEQFRLLERYWSEMERGGQHTSNPAARGAGSACAARTSPRAPLSLFPAARSGPFSQHSVINKPRRCPLVRHAARLTSRSANKTCLHASVPTIYAAQVSTVPHYVYQFMCVTNRCARTRS